MDHQEKIDFVLIWVDGSDPAWQAEKNSYLAGRTEPTAVGAVRYRDWDNLRYWFRGVEKYAPWVHQVHFVTWGHLPEWLNPDAPKLHIVRHSDYIPQPYLPTFSSHPIELNLHRIPGLAEQFVYFNDDTFLTAPVTPRDFFLHGLPRDSMEERPLLFSWKTVMNSVIVNDMVAVNQHFDREACRKQYRSKWLSLRDPFAAAKNLYLSGLHGEHFFGINTHHLPQAYLKTTFEQVWQAEPELLDHTCSHKFRDNGDVNQWIFKFWQLLSGQFEPYNKRKAGKLYQNGRDFEKMCSNIRNRQDKMICFNDSDRLDFEVYKQALARAFEDALPEKSCFEK